MSGSAQCRRVSDNCEAQARLLRLLDEALGLVDSLAIPPEIGARLQEVVDLTARFFRSDRPES